MVVLKNGVVTIRQHNPRLKSWILVILIAFLVFFVTPAESRSPGISYDDAKNGCICHGSSETNSIEISISGLPERFEASITYDLEISITGGPEITSDSQNHGGFSLSSNIGTFSSKDESTQLMEDGSISHTSEGNDQRTWALQWTAPSDDAKKAKFNLGGNSVNGDGEPNELDKWNFAESAVAGVNYSEEESSLYSLPFLVAFGVLTVGAIIRRNHV